MAFFLRIALISLAVALASAMSTCVEQGDWKACDADDQCTWCLGGSVGTGCYPLSAAEVLPKSFFTCDNEGYGATRNDDTCDNKTEDECISPECVWCTSAAVGGGCYTPTQAKLLPAAIFKCKTAPQAAAA